MRILMLAQFYVPILGGEERHVKSLCDELVARGHEVAVATLWRPGLADYEEDGGTRIYRIRSSSSRFQQLFSEAERQHAPPLPDPEAVLGLREVIRRERPEIVHAHNWLLYSFLPLKAWSKAGFVVTLHDFSLGCVKKRLMYQGEVCSGPGLLKCMTCSKEHYGVSKGMVTLLGSRLMAPFERGAVDLFIAVSQATADGNGFDERKLPYRVIPNFVPDNAFEQQPYSGPLLQQLPEEGYLLFVGDVTRDKGVHVLLEAYAGLEHAPPLILIGRRGADIPESLPPNVHLLGGWPHEAVLEAWERSSIALAPSVWPEPFGIVVIEAMASGKPVIATQIGGLTDIVIDGETGCLVPPGDPEALRGAIQSLLANPERAKTMGQAGKRRVALFQASSVISRIEQAYADVLSSRNGGLTLKTKEYLREEV